MKYLLVLWFSIFGLSAISSETYYCPMKCEGAKTYQKPGSCPVCGMDLESAEAGSKSRPLNTREYRMDLSLTPSEPKPGESVTAKFVMRRTKDNTSVTELDVVHERIMHLIIVSQDLSWFAHEHPERAADGSLSLALKFPHAGNYVLYADVTPKGDRNQVFPLAVSVPGNKRPSESLRVSGKKRKVGEYEVTLASDTAATGGPAALKFRVRRLGKDVTTLQPYLGALGHSVTISEDTTDFLHAHPAGEHHHHEGAGHAAPAKGGPEITFMIHFPRAGLYKTWLQFKHQDQVHTVDFVIRAQPPKRKA